MQLRIKSQQQRNQRSSSNSAVKSTSIPTSESIPTISPSLNRFRKGNKLGTSASKAKEAVKAPGGADEPSNSSVTPNFISLPLHNAESALSHDMNAVVTASILPSTGGKLCSDENHGNEISSEHQSENAKSQDQTAEVLNQTSGVIDDASRLLSTQVNELESTLLYNTIKRRDQFREASARVASRQGYKSSFTLFNKPPRLATTSNRNHESSTDDVLPTGRLSASLSTSKVGHAQVAGIYAPVTQLGGHNTGGSETVDALQPGLRPQTAARLLYYTAPVNLGNLAADVVDPRSTSDNPQLLAITTRANAFTIPNHLKQVYEVFVSCCASHRLTLEVALLLCLDSQFILSPKMPWKTQLQNTLNALTFTLQTFSFNYGGLAEKSDLLMSPIEKQAMDDANALMTYMDVIVRDESDRARNSRTPHAQDSSDSCRSLITLCTLILGNPDLKLHHPNNPWTRYARRWRHIHGQSFGSGELLLPAEETNLTDTVKNYQSEARTVISAAEEEATRQHAEKEVRTAKILELRRQAAAEDDNFYEPNDEQIYEADCWLLTRSHIESIRTENGEQFPSCMDDHKLNAVTKSARLVLMYAGLDNSNYSEDRMNAYLNSIKVPKRYYDPVTRRTTYRAASHRTRTLDDLIERAIVLTSPYIIGTPDTGVLPVTMGINPSKPDTRLEATDEHAANLGLWANPNYDGKFSDSDDDSTPSKSSPRKSATPTTTPLSGHIAKKVRQTGASIETPTNTRGPTLTSDKETTGANNGNDNTGHNLLPSIQQSRGPNNNPSGGGGDDGGDDDGDFNGDDNDDHHSDDDSNINDDRGAGNREPRNDPPVPGFVPPNLQRHRDNRPIVIHPPGPQHLTIDLVNQRTELRTFEMKDYSNVGIESYRRHLDLIRVNNTTITGGVRWSKFTENVRNTIVNDLEHLQ